MRKVFVFVVIFCVVGVFGDTYRELTKRDKKSFLKATSALTLALKENNTAGFLRFAPTILKQYESILLDPSCKKLRKIYTVLEMQLSVMRMRSIQDSIESIINLNVLNKNYTKAISINESYINFLKSALFDSLAKIRIEKNYKYQTELIKSGDVYTNYVFLSGLKYRNNFATDVLLKKINESKKDVLLRLSSSLNMDSLLAFKRRYPNVLERDINNLVEISKAQMKASICRTPTIRKIENYIRYFPSDDVMIEGIYEELLFKKFNNDKTDRNAQMYVIHFPDGKFKRRIFSSMDSLYTLNNKRFVVRSDTLNSVNKRGMWWKKLLK